MVCWKCAAELRKKGRYLVCTRCKAAYTTEFVDGEEVLAECISQSRISSKKRILLVSLGAVLVMIIGVVCAKILALRNRAQNIVKELENVGFNLSDIDYNQVISDVQSFLENNSDVQSILETESINIDEYISLIKAYLDTGDKKKAVEILQKAYELTGDERLKMMIAELSEPVSEPVKSVTIAGTDIDIDTTKRLLIIDKMEYSNGDWTDNTVENPDEFFDAVVYINDDLTAEDINMLLKLENLVSLRINYAGITSDHLAVISELTNLTELNLRSNKISDITPLGKLTALTTLELGENEISDNIDWLVQRLPE